MCEQVQQTPKQAWITLTGEHVYINNWCGVIGADLENKNAAAEYLTFTLNVFQRELILDLLFAGPINWTLANSWSTKDAPLEARLMAYFNPKGIQFARYQTAPWREAT